MNHHLITLINILRIMELHSPLKHIKQPSKTILIDKHKPTVKYPYGMK
jgi:hypothetical protein